MLLMRRRATYKCCIVHQSGNGPGLAVQPAEGALLRHEVEDRPCSEEVREVRNLTTSSQFERICTEMFN